MSVNGQWSIPPEPSSTKSLWWELVSFSRAGVKGSSRGISLVEVIVGTAIFLVALTGLITAYNVFVRAGMTTLGTIQATYLLEEGVEAMSIMRDYSWNSNIKDLAPDTNYYLSWTGGRWVSTTTVSKIDNLYSRYITIARVNRDSNDNIAVSGTDDHNTRELTVYVSWPNGATTTALSISSYFTNLFNN